MWLCWLSRFTASSFCFHLGPWSSATHLTHPVSGVLFPHQMAPVHPRASSWFARVLHPWGRVFILEKVHLSLPVCDATRLLEAYIKKNSLFAKGMCLCKTYSSAHCCSRRKITASANPRSLLTQLPLHASPSHNSC